MYLTIVLTETQRVATLIWSNTPGGGGTFSPGDGSPILLNLLPGAVMDTARNLNNETRGLAVAETRDTRLPGVTNITIDYNDGSIRITSNETMDVTPQDPLVVRLDHMVVSNVSRAETLEWLLILTAPISITEPARITVTQASSSATGILRSSKQDSWTYVVTGTHGVTEDVGATVSQGGSFKGTLAVALSNVWSLTIGSVNIVEEIGSAVTQGTSTGTLFRALTGAGTTEVLILAASGVSFDTNTDVALNGGSSIVYAADVSVATHTGECDGLF
jgi:hypothetical protein